MERVWGGVLCWPAETATLGAIFFMIGYGLLAVPNNVLLFFVALVFIVTGNGFFKPNVPGRPVENRGDAPRTPDDTSHRNAETARRALY